MGFHKRHTHGRVFRGLQARDELQTHRRDSHGNTPVMHVPQGFNAQQQDPSVAVSVVYVTLPQTFAGPAVYSTLSVDPFATSNVAAPAPAPTSDATPNFFSNPEPTNSQPIQPAPTPSSSLPTAASHDKPGHKASPTSLLTATSSPSTGNFAAVSSDSNDATLIAGTPIQATQTPTSQSVSSNQSSGSSALSSGAQAGLAFGIILGIALAGGLLYFCWRRKKSVKANHDQDEKHASFADAGARQVEAGARRGSTMTERVPASVRSTRTASTAPRLSLRPVTQFLPNLNENRRSTGNNLDVAAAGFSEKTGSSWERRPTHTDGNPFDDVPANQPRSTTPPSNPFDESEEKTSSDSQQAVAAGPMTNRTSPNQSWQGGEQTRSRPGQFGAPGVVPMPAGPSKDSSPPRGPNNVHRVQLDFKPSMDDELELRSGQLVRMLHEYDDGWALCIRMDRSQQGVAPRTCLSKLPVKPRPQGPGPNSRPGTSNGPRRPSNPPRPSNQTSPTMVPRPLTPTGVNRSSSPTDGNAAMSTSPIGTVPARKPVPGQAM